MTRARFSVSTALALAFSTGINQGAYALEFAYQTPETTASISAKASNSSVGARNIEDSKNPELSILRSAAEAYRKGDLIGGDTIAKTLQQTPNQIAAEWIAIRATQRSLGFDRLNNLITQYPDLPIRSHLLQRAETALFLERARPDKTLAFFKNREAETPAGKAILAAAKNHTGDNATATELALSAYRDRRSSRDIAEYLAKSFPEIITADQRALRAHMLILNNQRGEGLKLAATLGADQLKLAEALALTANKGSSMQPLEAVASNLREHASFKLAKAQVLRRQDKLSDARDLFSKTFEKSGALADSDEIWVERRVLARRLLDAGDAAGAFRVVAEHSAKSVGRQAEAEFHAGWIALRYLNFPQTALMHFERSAAIAELNTAKSRAAYWRGRAIEAGAWGDNGDSAYFYQAAAKFPATYYGQLAAAKLGHDAMRLPALEATESEDAQFLKSSGGQLIQTLLDAGLPEFATPVAMEFAKTSSNPAMIDAAIRRFLPLNNASTILALGRTATARGMPLEQHAFPTFGIPSYTPLPGSGEKAMVYAIARQESAFNPKAISHADARGLMQMLPSTASRTAKRFKVSFSPNRLIEDPAFCAQLGAAHLGELMEETKGSLVMTFASYNAGGGRVREWIAAAGDPRLSGVDTVDWVERIPFYETRNYVMKIMENLQVYRARMQGNQSALLIAQDMETGRRNLGRNSLSLE